MFGHMFIRTCTLFKHSYLAICDITKIKKGNLLFTIKWIFVAIFEQQNNIVIQVFYQYPSKWYDDPLYEEDIQSLNIQFHSAFCCEISTKLF